MANPKKFVIAFNYCNCIGCRKLLKKVERMEGVHSTYMDKIKKELTVIGTVKPETVIKKIKEINSAKGKTAKFLREEEEEEESPPEITQTVVQQNGEPTGPPSVVESPEPLSQQAQKAPAKRSSQRAQRRSDSHKVAPEPPGVMICTNVDKQMEKGTLDCSKHGHELEEKNFNKPFKCDICREEGFIRGYRCKHCVYDIHKDCLNPNPEVTPEFFKGFTFKFSQEHGGNCDACGMKIHGHSYGCRAGDLDLHPACSKLPGKLCIGGTDFVLSKKVKHKCFWCKMEKPSWLEVPGLWYVSEKEKFSCHVHCVSRVMHEAWKRGCLDSNHDDHHDGISKALEKVDWKLEAKAKRGGGKGGGLFIRAVTWFVKIIFGTLFGDPGGFIGSALAYALAEVIKELLPRL